MRRAFISYRRDPDFDWAMRIRSGLRWRGVGAFIDVKGLHGGEYERQIRKQIEKRSHYVLLLSRDSLKPRPEATVDWLRWEIDVALDAGRTFVPVLGHGFNDSDIELLSDEAQRKIRRAHSLQWARDDLQFGRMNRLARMITGKPPWPPVLALLLVMYIALAGILDLWPFNPGPDSPLPSDTAATVSEPTTNSSGPTTSPSEPATSPPVPSDDDTLEPNEYLSAGERIMSENGQHVLEMTSSGFLVGSTTGSNEWFRAPLPDRVVAGSIAYMGDDGNLVIYSIPGPPPSGDRWNSGTDQHSEASLVVRDANGTGYAVIVGADGSPIEELRSPTPVQPPASTAGQPDTTESPGTAEPPQTTTSFTTSTSSPPTTSKPPAAPTNVAPLRATSIRNLTAVARPADRQLSRPKIASDLVGRVGIEPTT